VAAKEHSCRNILGSQIVLPLNRPGKAADTTLANRRTDGSFLITPDALTETCPFRPHLAGGNI